MSILGSLSGWALVRRCAWWGFTISFTVLGSMCIALWIGMFGLLIYKSWSLDVTVLEVVHAVDQTSTGDKPPIFGSKTLTGALAPAGMVAIGTISCTSIAVGVGMVCAGVQRWRERPRR